MYKGLSPLISSSILSAITEASNSANVFSGFSSFEPSSFSVSSLSLSSLFLPSSEDPASFFTNIISGFPEVSISSSGVGKFPL